MRSTTLPGNPPKRTGLFLLSGICKDDPQGTAAPAALHAPAENPRERTVLFLKKGQIPSSWKMLQNMSLSIPYPLSLIP